MFTVSGAAPGAAQRPMARRVRARSRCVALPAVVALLAVAALAAGCGSAARSGPSTTALAAARGPAPPGQPVEVAPSRSHPRVVEPEAGVAQGGDSGGDSGGADAAADPYRGQAFVRVSSARADPGLARPVSNAEIRRRLATSGVAAATGPGARARLTPDGLAIAPADAPPAVKAVIAAGNRIARLPYRWGGGHATFRDTAYDCSGSLSYVFAAARLMSSPLVSGQLARWGDPGPGRWITIYANAGHTFMYIAGLRFDTGGLTATGSRWQGSPRDTAGFAVRHPPGL